MYLKLLSDRKEVCIYVYNYKLVWIGMRKLEKVADKLKR